MRLAYPAPVRARLVGLVVLTAVAAGCGHHAAAIPRLAHVPPTALGRSFLVDVSRKPSPRYVRLLRREALAARAEPVDVRAAPGAASVTLAVSDPAPFLKHRLQGFLNRTLLAHRRDVYLRVVDGRGARVLEWSVTGTEGTLWIRHDVFECSPIQPLSLPVVAEYPRCPA
jgi:hypothetical protein